MAISVTEWLVKKDEWESNNGFQRQSKTLGGNAEDGWIWKGKHPQSTAIPLLPRPDPPPFVTNILPSNHSSVMTSLNGEGNTDLFTDQYGEISPTENGWPGSVPYHSWPWEGSTQIPDVNATSEATMPQADASSWHGFKSIPLKDTSIPSILSEDTSRGIPSASSSPPNPSNLWIDLGGPLSTSRGEVTTEEMISIINTTVLSWSSPKSSDTPELFESTSASYYQSGLEASAVAYNTTNVNNEAYSADHIACVLILLILLICSIIGNTLVLFTILSGNYLRKTFFILYVNLAASNLLASIVSVPVLILAILQPDFLSPEFCIFISVSLILSTFISVGSIASISSIRWWQFYNFIQTRTHEKMVIRFIIFTLWVIGVGIIVVFISQDVLEFKRSCSLNLITETLQNTLPVTAISISIGLFTIISVNYLTIRKIQKKSIYTNDNQLSPTHAFIHFSKLNSRPANLQTNERRDTYDLNPVDSDDPSRYHKQIRKQKQLPARKNSRPTRNLCGKDEQCITGSKDHTVTKDHFNSKSEKISPLTVRKVSTLNNHTAPLENQVTFDPNNPSVKIISDADHLTLKCPNKEFMYYESEPESEHLYQVIEPQDTQEHFSLGTPLANNALESFVLPNAVESSNNSHTATWKHETIIAIEPSPPTNHCVNTHAWKAKKVINYLPKRSVKNDVDEISSTTEDQIPPHERHNSDDKTKILNPWPLLQSPLAKSQCSQNMSESFSCLEVERLFELPTRSQDISFPLPTSFPMMEIQDSLCAGYMADLSASSSKHSTPHIKIRKKKVTHKQSLKFVRHTQRQMSDIETDEESKYDELQSNKDHRYSPNQRASRRYQSCPGQPKVGDSDPTEELAIHPVRQKCVRTSLRLIALYSLAYLPLLALQVSVYITDTQTLALITLTYMVFLLAIHSTLYGFQSPILKNAIRKLGKKLPFTSKSSNINGDFIFNRPLQLTNYTNKFPLAIAAKGGCINRPSSAPPTRSQVLIPPTHSNRPSSHSITSSDLRTS